MLFSLSVLCLVILLMMLILKRWRQPYLVAYILTGLMLGPQMSFGTGVVSVGFYKTCVAVTALALLLSTGWVTILHRLIYKREYL